MAKSLLIVESPAKASTLKKFLGSDFTVKASMGHVKDLPKSKLGVDIENKFTPSYEVIRKKAKVLKELKEAAKNAVAVYLAPDPDREGEAIAWHIAEEIDEGKAEVYRVLFNEITRKAVLDAVKNPAKLDRNKYESQVARRVLDRLVGYRLSPLLWNKVRRGLSAGRVQSVAVRLISEREREITAFVPEEFWTIIAKLQGESNEPFEARLVKIKGEKAEVRTKENAEEIISALKGAQFQVTGIEKKERRRFPPPPFITSTLQQEAWKKLRFPVKKTMQLAQRLYEGVELGDEGSIGLITYMRTDSVRISQSAIEESRDLIRSRYGPEFLPESPNVYKSRKEAQEAHEAIRPTYFDKPPDAVMPYLDKDIFALYEMVWARFLACQMLPALYDQSIVDIASGDFLFRATGSRLKFQGFLVVYIEGKEDKEEGDEEKVLPDLKEGEGLVLLGISHEQHFTEPPPRYTDASLVKELEDKGIGRPSTYATILSTIQERGYTRKEKGRFHPTELGFMVTDLLVESFPRIMDVGFTAGMEEHLDEIEDGKAGRVEILREFYSAFEEDLKKAHVEMKDLKTKGTPTELKCDKCGNPMVIKWGRRGEFLACSNYPECKNTSDFVRDKDGKITAVRREESQEKCEKCGRPMAVKRSRYGEFLACTGYPECRNTRSLFRDQEGKVRAEEVELTEEKCPKCGGRMIIRRSHVGARFLSCENYPKCRSAKPMPVGAKCPSCGGDIVERGGRKGLFYGCINYPSCRYTSREFPASDG